MAAARAEFARKGLKGARIEDITAACGLSKGAFYLHFPSKEALFGELVTALLSRLGTLTDERIRTVEEFFRKSGPLDPSDIAGTSARMQALLDFEVRSDEQLLEHLWDYRDVTEVLISGSQGTEYEGVFWDMVDREMRRVAENCARLQSMGACRSDIPGELPGALVVGTYVVLAKQMARAAEKPDLAAWARSLHRLLNEGLAPPGTRGWESGAHAPLTPPLSQGEREQGASPSSSTSSSSSRSRS